MTDLDWKHSFFRLSLLFTAIVAAGAQDRFVWTKAGVHRCPTNYVPIGGSRACSVVSDILGTRYNSNLNGIAAADGTTAYCYISNIGADGLLRSRSVARVNNDYGTTDALVCRRANIIRQAVAVDGCPRGYAPIRDPLRCAVASTKLGIRHDAARNGNDDPRQEGVCFVTFVNGRNEMNPGRSTTQVNSNHDGRSAWICELWSSTTRSTITTTGPTPLPTDGPTANPTAPPTAAPTTGPTTDSTASPTALPTAGPTGGPTASPTAAPTALPTTDPTHEPSVGSRVKWEPPPEPPEPPEPDPDPTAAPTASATRASTVPAYRRQKRGVDRCPPRYAPITNSSACAAASARLGIANTPEHDGDWSTGEPVVCFVTNVDSSERLGNAVWPSTARVNSNHWESAAWICAYVGTTGAPAAASARIPEGSRAVVSDSRGEASAPRYPRYILQKLNLDRCPNDYAAVATDKGCGAASVALGIAYHPEYNGDMAYMSYFFGVKIVCFATNVREEGRVSDRVSDSSVTRLNSNHWSTAAWVCERVGVS